jgi:glycosyltransferase involved in cell wall biosynthesis
MSDQPAQDTTFTVIMPVYNHVNYVAQAIGSVIAQTRSDWKLIVIDDGSTDGSAELIDELAGKDERIVLIRQSNAGPAAARNAGLALGGGPWLTFIDSDDLWMPETLQLYMDYITAHPETQFIYGYRHRLNADGSTTESSGEFQDAQTGTAELFGRMYLSHLCVCWRRELLDKTGPYDASLRSCEDYELYLRLSLHTRFDPLGQATGLRRRHDTNISRQTGFSRVQEAEVLRRFVEHQGGDKLLDPESVTRRLGRLYYAAGRQYFKARCFAQARQAIKLAHRYCKTHKSVAIATASRCLSLLGTSDGREMPHF